MKQKFCRCLVLLASLAVCSNHALAVQTHRVDLGRDGSYDGSVRIERDAEGRMIFRDGDLDSGVTLLQLLSDPAKENTITVAKSGGEFQTLTEAYDAVTAGGLILVYPGNYTLTERLVLGPKGCHFVAVDSRGTTITVPSTSANIVVGNPTNAVGGEDWETADPYTSVGQFSFDGFAFESGSTAGIMIQRADMAERWLRVTRCIFDGIKGIVTTTGTTQGYCSSVNVEVTGCEFRPVDHETEEWGIMLANHSRGVNRGRYVIRDNVFNPRYGPPDGVLSVYAYGCILGGDLFYAEVRGNIFEDTLTAVWMTGSSNQVLEADSNTVTFRNSSDGFDPDIVAAFLLSGEDHNTVSIFRNCVKIVDSAPSPTGDYGIDCLFSSAVDNHVQSRSNDYYIFGNGNWATFGEETACVPGYALETTEDIWQVEQITDGSFFTTKSGDRIFRDMRADTATVVGAFKADSLLADKNLSLGATQPANGGTRTIVLQDGTAPTSNPADSIQLFADDAGGTTELKVRDEAGNTTTLSPHNFTLFKPDPSLPLPFSFYSRNERVGKEINVDMAGLAAEVERLSGKKFVYVRELRAGEKIETQRDRDPDKRNRIGLKRAGIMGVE